MSSKFSSERSPPQVGVGLSRKASSALRRNSSIHSGSFLCLEIMATISGSMPFLGVLKKYSSGSLNPYLYVSSPSSWMVLSSGIPFPPLALGAGAELLPHPVVAPVLELVGELPAARGHQPAVEHDVYPIRLNVPEDPLVVRDDDRAELRLAQLVDAPGDDLQRVDVEPRVGLVHDSEPGIEHEHLQDLVALLLAAGEPFIQVPLSERGVHPHDMHLLLQEPVHLHGRELLFAHRVDGGTKEVGHRDAGNLARVLEREEHPHLGSLVGFKLQDVLALEGYRALGNLVARMPHQHVRERALPRAVRAHDRVDLALPDLEVQTLDDLVAVNLNVQILYL